MCLFLLFFYLIEMEWNRWNEGGKTGHFHQERAVPVVVPRALHDELERNKFVPIAWIPDRKYKMTKKNSPPRRNSSERALHFLQQFVHTFLYGTWIIAGFFKPILSLRAISPVTSDDLSGDDINGFFLWL